VERVEVPREDKGESRGMMTISLRIDCKLRTRIDATRDKESLSEFVRKAIGDRLSGADNQVRDLRAVQLSNAIGSALEEVENHARDLREAIEQSASPALACGTCGLTYPISRERAASILSGGGKGPQCRCSEDDMYVIGSTKGIPAPAERLIQEARP
jgi:hypothetical protein